MSNLFENIIAILLINIFFISGIKYVVADSKQSSEFVKEKVIFYEMQNKDKLSSFIVDKGLENPSLPDEIIKKYESFGLIPFNCSYMDTFDNRATPPLIEQINSNQIKIKLAKNETKPISLGIWPLKNISEFSYTVSDLKNNKNEKINQVELGYIQFLKKINENKIKEYPGVILELNTLSLSQGIQEILWLEIKTEKNTNAGIYSGEIMFSQKGKIIQKIPLVVEVYPFVLDDANEWGRGSFSQPQSEKNLIFMKKHDMNMVCWFRALYDLKLVDNKLEINFEKLENYLNLLDKLGFKKSHSWFLGGSDPKIVNVILKLLNREPIVNARENSYKTRQLFKNVDLSQPFEPYFIEFLKKLYEKLKELGHQDFSVCLLDEPDHHPRPERMVFYKKIFEMVDKNIPELNLYGVFYHDGDEDKLSHTHDVWVTNRPTQKITKLYKENKKRFYTYHGNSWFYTVNLKEMRQKIGFIPWVYDADGTYFWVDFWDLEEKDINEGKILDPFCPEENKNTLSIPTLFGPLASLGLKGFQAGVQDRKYLITFKKLIDKSLQSNNVKIQTEAKKQQEFLNSLQMVLQEKMIIRGGAIENAPEIKIKNLQEQESPLVKDSDFTEFFRETVIERILKLQQVVNN